MKKKLLPFFLIFTAVSLACNFATSLVPSTKASGVTPPAPNPNADGLSAEATTDGGVLLQWVPFSGAEKYLVEVQIADEFVQLTTLPADQTSYEDRNVPDDTRFTYRVSSLMGTAQGESKEITVETPLIVSNPLQVTLEFDQAPAPLSIDPNNFDPSTIDPENFDSSMFLPQPVQTEAVIGPQGGEISVTDSNGVIYTLSVPPDALQFDVTITLKPISGIPDLPLSGGLMAAVFIEPESLVFDVPATLKMTPPAGVPAAAGPLALAFAFEAEGQEFHLYPFATDGAQGKTGGHLASLKENLDFIHPLSGIAKLRYGGGYGDGSGTAQDVKAIVKKPTSKPQNRAAQRLAVSQLDELTPLGPDAAIEFGKEGEAILQKVGQADDWSKLMDALDVYSEYLNAGGNKYEFNRKLNDKILDLLVDKAKKLLDKNKGGCLTEDDFKARELVERLTNPKSSFSKALAARFIQKYGQQTLNDLAQTRITCSFKLTMDSTLTFTAEGSTLHAGAKIPALELFPVYAKGKIYLTGEGTMMQDFRVTGICSFPLKHYDNLKFFVGNLTPLFGKDGTIADFNLSEYAVRGWINHVNVAITESGKGCPTMVQIKGGGDYWTGLFIAARFNMDTQKITNWDVQTNWTADDSFHSLQAVWVAVQPSFTPFGVAGTTSSENTKFELKVTKTSK